MIDVHSHILPGIDDGSRDTKMSLMMLKESFAQGIETMIATPHFYINRNEAEVFLEKRKASFEKLKEAANKEGLSFGKDIPKVYTGSEVLFFRGISKYKALPSLTVNEGKYLLLEMPFSKWNDSIISEVEDIMYTFKLQVVIAHIERFLEYQKGTDLIEKLLSLGVTVQMNAEYINSFFTRGKALKLIKEDVVQVLGSDCHNMEKRPPNLRKSIDIIEKKLGHNFIDKFNKIGYNMIN